MRDIKLSLADSHRDELCECTGKYIYLFIISVGRILTTLEAFVSLNLFHSSIFSIYETQRMFTKLYYDLIAI